MSSLLLRVSQIVRPTDEVAWRIFTADAYIAALNERINRVKHGYYRDITLKSGRVVTRHYKSSGTVDTWLPYLDSAQRERDALDHASPSVRVDVSRLTLGQVSAIVYGLSNPSKMPCYGYNLPAEVCIVGSRLRESANSPCHFCYARKGRYVFPDVMRAMYRRLASLMHPNWADAMVRLIGHYSVRCTSRICPHSYMPHTHYRWHDSGDVQSVQHMANIADVARRTPSCIHWIPTQERKIVTQYRAMHGIEPENLIVRFSATRTDVPIHPWQVLPGTVASYVNTGKVEDDASTYYCPSRSQDGKCGDCRACWTRDVQQVAYHVH
jgi:hypothetical protein